MCVYKIKQHMHHIQIKCWLDKNHFLKYLKSNSGHRLFSITDFSMVNQSLHPYIYFPYFATKI